MGGIPVAHGVGDFADCDRRLRLFIDGYNFQRPHQGIEGMTPADRFFRLAPQVRAAVEQAVATNATRLALERPAQKPFYLVGRLGDQDLTIAAGGGGLQVQMGDVKQTIALPKERDDEEQSIPARIRREEARAEEKASSRPTPKWLLDKQGLEEIARRRCLVVLEILSGARPVTDVLAGAQISRGTYYKLEERALGAMLRALSPTAGADGTDGQALSAALSRTAELEAKLARAEQEKRRADKLNFLTRKLVKPGPLTTGVGRLPGSRNRPRSTTDGPKPSRRSKLSASNVSTTPAVATPSTPTVDGATAR